MKKLSVRILLCLLSVLTIFFTACQTSTGDKEDQTRQTESNATTDAPIASLPLPLPTEAYSSSTLSENDTVHSVSGLWKWENGSLTGDNVSGGNCFAMTNLYTSKGVAFSIEADIEIVSGRAIGIVFGVADQDNPTSLWYCFNVDKNAKNTRLFSNGEGTTVGDGANTRRSLTDSELNTSKYRMKLEYDAKGNITCSLNGSRVAQYRESIYAGGFIGFYTYYASCKISNISYQIGNIWSPAYNMVLEMDGKTYPIDPNALSVALDLGQAKGRATLRFNMMEGYEAKIAGAEYYETDTVEHRFSPAYGADTLTVVFSDADNNKNTLTLVTERQPADDIVYTDQYRPQYHYSPKMYFMNDPNGLVYNATTKEYHLFYQYSPGLFEAMGNQVWGHAVSKDLVNWTELGIAIDREDNGGRIYSGSAVIDYNNTTGFFDNSIPPASRMVVIYTIPGTIETQNLAYSLDDGYTWIKYEGNPVITAPSSNVPFRDPKVRWIEDASLPGGGIWLAVIGGTQAQLYTSPDMKTWTFNSYIRDTNGTIVTSECPDLFQLAVDGDTNNMKWVYSGSGLFYIVGDLVKGADGKYTFQATQAQRTDYVYSNGRRFYATQSYFNTPSGDTVSISWSRDGVVIEDKYWAGCMTLPYKVGLTTMSDGSLRLTHNVIEDVDSLRGENLFTYGTTSWAGGTTVPTVESTSFAIDALFKLEKDTEMRLELFSNGSGESAYITFKSDSAGKVTATVSTVNIAKPNGSSWAIPLELNEDGTIDLKIYGDASIIEIFINGGKYTFCERIFPSKLADKIMLKVKSGSVNVTRFDCYEMESIWKNTAS